MNVDPLASMRCWAMEIELGGRTFEIPALPAVSWWPVLATGDLSLILDFVTSTDGDGIDLDDMLLSGELSHTDLVSSLTDAVQEAAGRSLHAATVLASVARAQWAAVNGTLVRSGFRWDQQPLGAALDAVYSVIVERLDGDNLANFLALLDNDKPREKVVEEFETLAGPRPTTGVVASGERSGSARPRTRPRPQHLPRGARSAGPRTPRAPHADSGPPANSAIPADGGGPTSGTVPPPHPSGR